mmetsp:Transcript_14713/g.13201  ORF Transcript_14713/g.13201 Transcript_14713/m.13201 type:complete len:279 (+) Transcript_14713:45-881(+)
MQQTLVKQAITTNIEVETENNKGPPKKDYGRCGMWKWYGEAPMKRFRFLIFFICGCVTVIWLLMFAAKPDEPGSYIFAGIICILMSLWAVAHFRLLTKLTNQVDKLYHLNLDFSAENRKLRKDVMTLSKTEKHLSGVQHRIGSLNKKLKANIMKFQELDKNLRTISDSNIKGIEKIQKKSRMVMDSMNQSLVRSEKSILHSVYDNLEWDNNMKGLSKQQFDMFWKKLPRSYYKRWLNLGKSFEDLAGDNGILDYKEFTQMVDDFAKKEAAQGGSNDNR